MRGLLHVLVWVSSTACATVVTVLFLVAWVLLSYELEQSLASSLSAAVASGILDIVFCAAVILVWAAAGLVSAHLAASLRLWAEGSKSGYMLATGAATAISAAFVAIEAVPLAAAGMLLGAYLGSRTGRRAAARDDSVREAILDETGG